MSRHTIVLVQPTNNKASRTFMDFETIPMAMDAICVMFEKRLRELNPNMRNITYDISDLYAFVDRTPDLSALVFNPQLNAYEPHDKAWLKDKIFKNLKKQAEGR